MNAANTVPGVLHCARCKFRLIRTVLSAVDGSLAAGSSSSEPCPNGCGPLWSVTWEQEAREAWAAAEGLLDRAVKAEASLAAAAIPDGWTLMPIEPTPDELMYAQGALMDISWDAVTCFAARYSRLIQLVRRRRDGLATSIKGVS